MPLLPLSPISYYSIIREIGQEECRYMSFSRHSPTFESRKDLIVVFRSVGPQRPIFESPSRSKRVSKQEQNEALQRDALKEADCEKFFNDKITGSKFERKGLEELLAFVRAGD